MFRPDPVAGSALECRRYTVKKPATRLIAAAKEALAIVRGEAQPARIHAPR